METHRKQVLESVLETIHCISDRDYQKRIWIQGKGPEVDDFDETCCNFFDIGDPMLSDYKNFGITENQYQVLKRFRDQFRGFSDKNDWPEEFIDTPEWEKVTEMAKEVLQAFDYKKKSYKKP